MLGFLALRAKHCIRFLPVVIPRAEDELVLRTVAKKAPNSDLSDTLSLFLEHASLLLFGAMPFPKVAELNRWSRSFGS